LAEDKVASSVANKEDTVGMTSDFVSRISYELKRAERYRIFLSLVIFNVGPVLDIVSEEEKKGHGARTEFLDSLGDVVRRSVREIDAVSNHGRTKIGLLFPETPRQGAEAAARRIAHQISAFCKDYFRTPVEYLLPVEISSFPDAAGARSIASYFEEFGDK
jgi:GGDEF domain-containing protein